MKPTARSIHNSILGIIMSSVCPSVILNSVHSGVQGHFRVLKVVTSCSYEGTSYSLLQTL